MVPLVGLHDENGATHLAFARVDRRLLMRQEEVGERRWMRQARREFFVGDLEIENDGAESLFTLITSYDLFFMLLHPFNS